MPVHASYSRAENLAVQREIRKWTILGLVLALLSLGTGVAATWTLVLAHMAGPEQAPLGTDQMVDGLRNGSFLLALACAGSFAKSKGRSEWFALLGALSCLGVLILTIVEKKCRRCGEAGKWNANACWKCGAPLSLRWKPRPEPAA